MTQKITIPRDKRQDRIDAFNARKQGGRNPFVEGIYPDMEDEGVGVMVSRSRTKYGNSNVMPNEVIQAEPGLENKQSNFSFEDAPGNSPIDNDNETTGSVRTQSSFTSNPQNMLNNDRLTKKLAMYQQALGNAKDGNNDRGRTV